MSKLVVNNVYIYSLKEKKAFHAKFEDGINFVTSCKENGNKRGKSIIMKSIYSTLGADCIFEPSWDFSTKTTILDISIDDTKMYFLRANDYFKIIDSNYNEIFATNHRSELSYKLKEIFGFYIELPDRDNELKLAPPAYMYLLNYVDQVGLNCTTFSSFERLGQFANYKKYVLLSHFGIFNKEYYELDSRLKAAKEEISNNELEKNTLGKLITKLENELSGNDYSLNSDLLNKEISLTKKDYEKIVDNLNNTKNKIIKFQNSKMELEKILDELNKNIKDNDSNYKKYDNETCPYCKSHIQPFEFSYKYYDKNDDYLFISQSLIAQLLETKRNIQMQEEKYKGYINDMDLYNAKIKSINSNIDDVLKHKGYIEMRNKLSSDLYEITQKNVTLTEEVTRINKKIREYANLEKKLNDDYFNLMSESKDALSLKEIFSNNFKKIDSSFSITGSTRPISTIAWYLTLLKLKDKYNPNAIRFPIVLDSPNNAELDNQNISKTFKYILDNINRDCQIIISTIEFKKEMYSEYNIKNVINLNNQPYLLLNNDDYLKNIQFYKKIMNI